MTYSSQRIDLANRLTLHGAREVEEVLKLLGVKGARSAGASALRMATKALLDAARLNVPTNEGRLRRALAIRNDRGRKRPDLQLSMLYVSNSKSKYRPRKTLRKSRVKGRMGPARYPYQIGSKPNVYGAFLEFGAPEHGIAPMGWMRKAWEQAGGENSVKIFSEALGPAIIALAMKHGIKALR